jgi:hypothetical protein
MKKLIITFLLTVLMAFSLSIGIAVAGDSFGKVDTVKGNVEVLRTADTLDAKKGMDLLKEDTLKTGSDSSITVVFKAGGITGTVESEKEVKVNDLYLKTKINTLKGKIKRPDSNITPAKISVDTIGGARGTEEGEKKSKDLKNDHYWDEKVE